MTSPHTVLLFAAGLGTRMAPLTDMRPKPLVSVAGKPLLDYALDQCRGLNKIVNVHYLADQIMDHLKDTDVLISDETDLLRETGGGLKHALPILNEDPVFTMNTDAVWKGANPIQALNAVWQPEAMETLLLLIPRENAVAHTGSGDFDLTPNASLKRGTSYVYTGAQIIHTDRLAEIKEDAFSMWSLWNGMLERGTMFGAIYDGQWCDVGRPESIKVAEDMLGGQADV